MTIKTACAALEDAGKKANSASMGARFNFAGHIADGSAGSENYIAAKAALLTARTAFESALAEAGMLPSGPAYGEGINWATSWTGKTGMVVMSSGSSGWPMVHFGAPPTSRRAPSIVRCASA